MTEVSEIRCYEIGIWKTNVKQVEVYHVQFHFSKTYFLTLQEMEKTILFVWVIFFAFFKKAMNLCLLRFETHLNN